MSLPMISILSMRTHCYDHWAQIHHVITGCTATLLSSITLWSTRSKPFLSQRKTTWQNRNLFPERTWCSKAWVVDFPGGANCLISYLSLISENNWVKTKPSIILEICGVKEIGLKSSSSSTLWGIETFGNGTTIERLKSVGKMPWIQCCINIFWAPGHLIDYSPPSGLN